MYSNEVDYSTLTISSWNRHAEDAVLPSSPTDATPNTEEAQTTAEGRGQETPHDRPCTPGHHGGNAGGANLITSSGNGEGTTGTCPEAVHGLRMHQPPGVKGCHVGRTTAMSGQAGPGPSITEEPDVPAPAEGHL
jgi:hypothetical protein